MTGSSDCSTAPPTERTRAAVPRTPCRSNSPFSGTRSWTSRRCPILTRRTPWKWTARRPRATDGRPSPSARAGSSTASTQPCQRKHPPSEACPKLEIYLDFTSLKIYRIDQKQKISSPVNTRSRHHAPADRKDPGRPASPGAHARGGPPQPRAHRFREAEPADPPPAALARELVAHRPVARRNSRHGRQQ